MTTTFAIEPLLELLVTNTRAGVISWTVAAGMPHVYRFAGDSGLITVSSRDHDGLPPFRLIIQPGDGSGPEEFTDLDSATDLPRLFHLAKDSARGGKEPSLAILRALAEQRAKAAAAGA